VKEDGAMPSSKNDLIQLYEKCVSRNARMSLLGPHGIGTNNASIGEHANIQAEVNNTTELNDAPIVGKTEM
jgi:hypothetical protein